MPHERSRHLLDLARKAMRHSKIVGILGQRQVGKTTFLGQLAARYATLDDPGTLESCLSDPSRFVTVGGHPLAIDEAQLAPPLFPALKEYVRAHPAPGRFVLSGSIRFTSRRAIRESLTGRIMNLELLPFSISEQEGEALPTWGLDALEESEFSHRTIERLGPASARARNGRGNLIAKYLERGGLPGICLVREPAFRARKLADQVYTLLDRDLRLVAPTTLTYLELISFARELARTEGTPLSHSDLRRATGISPAAQKKLLYALEAVFLIRLLRIEGGRKGMIVLLEDQAEQRYLSDGKSNPISQYEGLVFRNLRTQWAYRIGETPEYFHYLTPDGARIPFAVRTPKGILGFAVFGGSELPRPTRAAIHSFLRSYGAAKAVAVSLDPAFEPRVLDPRTLLAPLALLV